MHIAMHAFGKITLFFCAGAIMVAAHKSGGQPTGTGWAGSMPVTFAAFLIGTLSIVGLPPTGGVVEQVVPWAWDAVEAGQIGLVAVLMLSSLLSLAYLMEIPLKGILREGGGGGGPRRGPGGP